MTRQAEWAAFNPDAGTRIIGKVQDGRWTPARAEAVASRLGLAPFERAPDASQFDPLLIATWSLPMTVAWISWRDMQRVRQCWTNYRAECWEWRKREFRLPIDGGKTYLHVSGSELVQLEPMTLVFLSLSEAVGETAPEIPQQMSVRSAREALWQALAEGKIAASAISQATGRPLEIPAFEWPYIEHTGANDLEDQLRFTGAGHAEYHTLTFRRADVLLLWPHDKGADQADTVAPAAAPKPSSEAQSDQPKVRRKRSHDQERVRPFLEKLYPEGVPEKAVISDAMIRQTVSKAMDDAAKADPRLQGAPSRETILRAAGRM